MYYLNFLDEEIEDFLKEYNVEYVDDDMEISHLKDIEFHAKYRVLDEGCFQKKCLTK